MIKRCQAGISQMRFIVTAGIVLLALGAPLALGQAADESGFQPDAVLTGDWGGQRSSLAENGVILDLRHTSFYQGLASGTGSKSFEYGGKMDAFISLDTGKMGLWHGGKFHTHLEYSLLICIQS